MMLGLLLSLLLGIWIGMAVKTIKLQAEHSAQQPVRRVTITIDPSQREELFVQLREFGDKWGYAIRIAPLDPNNKSFSVAMWRADIKVLGLYPTDPGTLNAGFYNTDRLYPIPDRFFDEEISDLEIMIGEISSAAFSVEK
jgi:hypothetical protein